MYEPWRASFTRFAEDILAEIGPKPGPQYSLDRENNDGGYEPGNVRWATASQQNSNQRPRRFWPPRDNKGRFL